MTHRSPAPPHLPYHVVAWKSAVTILIIAPCAMTALGLWLMMFMMGSWSSRSGSPAWAVSLALVTPVLPCLVVYAAAVSIWMERRTRLVTLVLMTGIIALSMALYHLGPKLLQQATSESGPDTLRLNSGFMLYLLVSGWLLCLWETCRPRRAAKAALIRQPDDA